MKSNAGLTDKLALRACAAAVGCAFAFGAGAQSLGQPLEQIQAGLDRGVRLPLEIIWLQSEIQAEMWRAPALAHALQACAKTGAPKEGCAVSVRSAWRYSFDASSAVRTAPIVISSLGLADAPFAKGRLNLSGSGRVFLVTSPGERSGTAVRPPSGVILLAAGSTVQLVDAAYPSIQIEVKAPADQPLFLGNLADAEIGKIFALLVQPTIASASAADVLQEGKVALRVSPADPLMVASIDLRAVSGKLEVPIPDLPRAARIVPDFSTEVSFDQDFTALAAVMEWPSARPATIEAFAVASVDLSGLSGHFELPISDLAKPVRLVPAISFDQDFGALAAVVESPSALPAKIEPFTVASIDLSALSGRFEMPVHGLARLSRKAPAAIVLDQDFSPLASAIESPSALPAKVQPLALAAIDLTGISGNFEMPVHAIARLPQPPAVQSAAAKPSTDLARMRAEVEAEIARENERVAQLMHGRATKPFRFGT